MTEQHRSQLIAAALAARQRAYAPYSKFSVGAAVLTSTGGLFPGCNIENSSYGLTICAERAAIANAVSAGNREIIALAIASAGAVTPCGACRQVMVEFAKHLPVFLVDANQTDHILQTNLSILLPDAFTGPFVV
jgi:cytidine deaminase